LVLAFAASSANWLSPINPKNRDRLATRLDAYVKAHCSQNWANLFGLVSDSARGGVAESAFTKAMSAGHRRNFSNNPDLLQFRPERTIKSEGGEYDIYGCGKAQREGQEFNGVALIHAVFEHNDWFFSGWSFTEFPNEPCKALSDASWEPPGPMEWGRPMGELRDSGLQFHTDDRK